MRQRQKMLHRSSTVVIQIMPQGFKGNHIRHSDVLFSLSLYLRNAMGCFHFVRMSTPSTNNSIVADASVKRFWK